MFQTWKLWFQLFVHENQTPVLRRDFHLHYPRAQNCLGQQRHRDERCHHANFVDAFVSAQLALLAGDVPQSWDSGRLSWCAISISRGSFQETLDWNLHKPVGSHGRRYCCLWPSLLNYLAQTSTTFQTSTLRCFHAQKVWNLREWYEWKT